MQALQHSQALRIACRPGAPRGSRVLPGGRRPRSARNSPTRSLCASHRLGSRGRDRRGPRKSGSPRSSSSRAHGAPRAPTCLRRGQEPRDPRPKRQRGDRCKGGGRRSKRREGDTAESPAGGGSRARAPSRGPSPLLQPVLPVALAPGRSRARSSLPAPRGARARLQTPRPQTSGRGELRGDRRPGERSTRSRRNPSIFAHRFGRTRCATATARAFSPVGWTLCIRSSEQSTRRCDATRECDRKHEMRMRAKTSAI